MRYDGLIFDIDGTLWDSCENCAKGWNKILGELEIDDRITPENIASVTGKPFEECARILLPGLDPINYDKLSDGEKWALENHDPDLYEGVLEGIEQLAQDRKVFLVSNCQDWYLDKFIEFSGLNDFLTFSDCYGKSLVSKGVMLQRLVDKYGLTNPVYIGDTQTDFIGSKEAGMDFIYASYGFGEVENPKYSFHNFKDIVNFLS